MTNHFYRFIMNGYEEEAGIITSPDINLCPNFYDAEQIVIDKNFIYQLEEGKYPSYTQGPHCENLVCEELKELLEQYSEKEFVEFIPVTIKSEEYGDRQYYIVHFKKIYDVIDKENTVYGPINTIIKLRVDYEKVKNLHVFNSQPNISDLNVSTKVYKEIKKRKLNFGLSFGIVRCLNKE